ncbi:hypothetical protein Ga0466249_005165 [Sporomusaceae bacterium BoRhaA]|uniref:hypothetical protein n=1 Tax=Pelorhabdus rhamnosifermentans TaxID=2772457 RepID=UPI001C061709|nr:hypothetical protein [Pelorhabdus rhamnosifermentans]MBU2704013.1 hypothetical protein [Pelorhabdus rhamnosifermentans]
MHLCNRAGWPERFTVASSTLLGLLGYSYSALSRARTELAEAVAVEEARIRQLAVTGLA